MKSFSFAIATPVLLASLMGSTALADVSAQQVWDNWSGQMDKFGQEFTTSDERMVGNTLTLSDLTIRMFAEDGAIVATLGDVRLVENGDGTVSVSLPESYPMVMKDTPAGTPASTIRMTVFHDAMVMTVSGTPDQMNYDITADRYAFQVDGIEGDGAQEIEINKALLAIHDLRGVYAMQAGDISDVTYELDAAAVDLDLNITERDGDGHLSLTADMADFAVHAHAMIPEGLADMDGEDADPFGDGLSFDAGYQYGATAIQFDAHDDDGTVQGSVTLDGDALRLAMDYDGIAYTGATRGVALKLMAPDEFPFPIEVSLAQLGYDIQLPLSRGEGGPRDLRLAFDVTDLSVSDFIWMMVDQQNMLPHDPITLAFDMDAQVTLFFDMLNPQQLDTAMVSEMPGELNSLTLNNLTLRGVGAEITGTGAFTFDNADELPFLPGMPRPTGKANFALNGINGLIDTATQMGLLPPDQAMMPRMMLGMIGVPVGDDMLTSEVELNNSGQLLVNGQRLQ